ncbi:MAG: hypothetical protein L3J98_10510 [Gammaproteobacteria bacterium]|nr:hypothetical protein [Gammaproteobacteria bacterium]MCF6260569.1 hypothetical protein [Gammaproteobacteria bacterium]
MGSLDSWVTEFKRIGWFIPPYITMGQMDNILGKALRHDSELFQAELENILSSIYSENNLANLFIEKYSETPFINDYIQILENGVEAHFLGMHYSAVATLIPVIEGASRQLAIKRGVEHKHIKQTIRNLCKSCKDEVVTKKLGEYGEVESMIDSFEYFIVNNMYSKSSSYPQEDKTNRNGITHGSYNDSDYGTPINFYKTIAAINSLCFLSAIDSGLSWFPPKGSEAASKKSVYYSLCTDFSKLRVSYS